MLDRRKSIDVFPQRKYDNAARVLARASSDACASLQKALDLAVSLSRVSALKVILYIAIRCFFSDCRDRAGFKSLLMAEDDFGIGVRLTLVFAGEVEVDIGLLYLP